MGIAVSIITVYYNAPGEILKLAASLEKHLEGHSYDWIVMDNHSSVDLTGKIACTKYIRLPQNFGFAKACNLAAQETRRQHLFFLNPDCVLTHDCIAPLLAAMHHSAVAGPKVLNPDGTIQLSFGPSLSVWSEAVQRLKTKQESHPLVQTWLKKKTSTHFHPDYVSGCALMIRADVFEKLGGFDPKFFLYEEDVDLCKRVREADHRITYVPEAKLIHARNQSTKLQPQRSRAEYLISQSYYYKKHHGALQNSLLKFYRKLSK